MTASRVPILCYHGVADRPATAADRWTVQPDEFERQMAWLAASDRVVLPLAEFAEAITSGLQPDKRAVVLTFDDGYRDFLTTALPVLERHGLHATLFASTGLLGRSPADSRKVLAPMLSWDELAEVAARGVEVGAHSHSHRELDVLRRPVAEEEIALSRELLEAALGRPVQSFAYPYGYNSAATRRAVRRVGYSHACGVKNAYSHRSDDVWSLARFLITRDLDLPAFQELVAGRAGPVAPRRDSLVTRGWRCVRQVRGARERGRRAAEAVRP